MAELSTPPTQPYPGGIAFVAITPHCPGPERCTNVNGHFPPPKYKRWKNLKGEDCPVLKNDLNVFLFRKKH